MITLATFSIRRPVLAIVTWLVVGLTLAGVGIGVTSVLSPPINVVPGTESSRAQHLAGANFGPTQLVPILLEGPRAQLDRQGPALVRALDRRPDTRTLSGWDAGSAGAELRPSPRAAMIVASVARSERDAVRHAQPQIERLVDRTISAPVRAYVTGQPSIDRAERDAALSRLRSDELIAVGILFVLLLVGLRAPVSAALVTAVGAVSMLAGFGEVTVLGHILTLDPVGVAAGTMTGLALGVAFALLIIDRFEREERRLGLDARDHARAAIRDLGTTGHAVLVAGTIFVVALAIVAVVGPTQLMVSVGTGALTCAAFATGGAVVVMPAALVLLGPKLVVGRAPAPAPAAAAWRRLVHGGDWVTRHGLTAGTWPALLLALLAVPIAALRSGPVDISQLPRSAPARVAFEEVSRVMGPGWATPFNLVVLAKSGPLTEPALLRSLGGLQSRIAADPAVTSVTGPSVVVPVSKQLSTFGPQLKHSARISEQSKSQLLELIAGLGQAGGGSAKLQAGLAAAAAGSQRLQAGGVAATGGAAKLRSGLVQARAGSSQLGAGLSQALTGAQALQSGAGQALAGATRLASGLGKGAPQVKAGLPAVATLVSSTAGVQGGLTTMKGQATTASSAITRAIDDLSRVPGAATDPAAQATLAELTTARTALQALNTTFGTTTATAATAAFIAAGVNAQVSALSPQLTEAAKGAAALATGIAELRNGNAKLAAGLAQLNGGGTQLHSGLGQLTAGAGALEVGLDQLAGGAGALATGLSSGVSPAGQLVSGLATMQAAVAKSRGQIPSTAQLRQLERQSPAIFSSGYFVLAALAGAMPANRNAVGFTINLTRGGTAGQIVVTPRYAARDLRTARLGTRLTALARRFALHNDVEIAVGGPAGGLGDLTHATRSRIWLDVAALALAMAVILGLALRAMLLPLLTTAAALLVTASAFGVLQLLFGGGDPPLGGPGYLDPITIISVFTVGFALTAIPATLLLTRARETFVATGDAGASMRVGLRETAAPATGAGLVMIAALIPFSLTGFLTVRVLGIGVAVVVLLATFLVRPALLPGLGAALGRRAWWPTVGHAPAPPSAESGPREPEAPPSEPVPPAATAAATGAATAESPSYDQIGVSK